MAQTKSEKRMAANQTIFRDANQRLQKGIDHVNKIAIENGSELMDIDRDIKLSFYCECSDENCRKRIKLSLNDYNAVHEVNDRFTIACGHEAPSIEDVTYTSDEYCVVTKHEQPPQDVTKLQRTPVNNQ